MGKTAILSVKIISDAKDAMTGMRDAASSADGFGAKLASISPGALAVGGAVVAGVVGAGKALYDLGSTFDDVADTIRVGTGATGANLDGLVDVAHQVATSVPTSFEDAGQTVADLNTRLGLSGDTLKTVSSQYLEAGRILGEDVDINSTSAAFSAFKLEGDQVSGAMDDLFRVSQATGVGMNDLAASVQGNALALQEMGFDFANSAALAGMLDKAGVDADSTLNAMRKGMLNMAQPGEDMQDTFNRVTRELQGYIDKGDTAGALDVAGKVFGTKGAAQMVQALQTGAFSLDDLMHAAGATGDTILGVGADTMDAAEKWQILKNKGQAALEPLASAIFTTVGDALGAVTTWIDSTDFTPLATAFSSIGSAVSGVVTWFQSLDLTSLTTAFTTASPVLTSAGETLKAIGDKAQPTIIAIRDGLTPVIQTLAPVFSTIFTTAVAVVSAAWSTITGVLSGALDVIKGIFTIIKGIFTGDWSAVWAGTRAVFSGAWTAMSSIVSGAWSAIRSIVSGGIRLVTGVLSGLGGILSRLFSGAWSSARSAVSSGVSSVVSLVRSLPSRAAGALGGVGSALRNAGRDLISGFINGIKSAIGGVKDTLTGLTSKLTSWKGPESLDRVLLTPAGEAVISGFITGLERQYPSVRASLSGLTKTLGSTDMGSLNAPTLALNPATVLRRSAPIQTFNITVNGVLDGDDAARKIEQIMRRQSWRTSNVEVTR